MKSKGLRFLLCIGVVILSACASSRFLEFTTEDFDKEDEYDAAIAVQPSEKEVKKQSKKDTESTKSLENQPAKVSSKKQEEEKKSKATPVEKKNTKQKTKSEKGTKKTAFEIENKKLKTKTITKKNVKKLMKTEVLKKGRKLPMIEDAEGFDGRRPEVEPFRVGEEVRLGVRYFGVKAGELRLKVLPFKIVNGRKAYHFRVEVVSSRSFSMVYEVDDWAETFVDYETLLPYNYAVHVNHSNEKKQIKSVFDHVNNKIKIWEKRIDKDGKLKKGSSSYDMIAYSQNVISVFYYIRAFQLEVGKTIKFPLVDEDNSMVLEAEVIRKENIKTPKGERETLVVKPKVSIEGKFKPVGDVYLWLSNDDRKQILRVESELKIGTLKFDLISVN